MHTELIDHAARILDRVPSRCMRADALHERAARETGQAVPYPRFLQALRERGDRFVLLEAAVDVGTQAYWSERERDAYAVALAAAGCTGAPVVALAAAPLRAELEHGPAGEGPRRHGPAAAVPPAVPPAAPAPPAEVLAAVHEALAELLHAADASLHEALAAAAAELESLSRALEGTRRVRPAS